MAFEIGTATKGAGTALSASAHYVLLAKIKTFVETVLPTAERWVSLRQDLSTDAHEEIWKAPGKAGTEEIFMGIQTFQDTTTDAFNLLIAVFTGYDSSSDFQNQPGIQVYSLPVWEDDIPYWIRGSGQSLVIVAKLQAAYLSGYIGKMYPYSTPSQYPYPVVCGGCSASHSARYSVANTSWWTDPLLVKFRDTSGIWTKPLILPSDVLKSGSSILMPIRNTSQSTAVTAGHYSLIPIELATRVNSPSEQGTALFGRIEGVFFISGFSNGVENTLAIDGKNYIVFMWHGTPTN